MSSYDARLELWEALCTCGGSRKSPDVRMCRCLAPDDAGLSCQGCGCGVMLIKSGPRGYFWGCSKYKKLGCKFTMPFGSPHDRAAVARLEGIRCAEQQEREELERIVDPHEQEWREMCHCGGAKNLNTFECYMQSEGGCGFLPLCPRDCGGGLFLKNGSRGRYWQCSQRKNGCTYNKTYVEHASNKKRKAPPQEVLSDVCNRGSPKTPTDTTNKTTTLTPEQKALIEAKRQAAIAKCLSSPERQAKVTTPIKTDGTKLVGTPSPGASPAVITTMLTPEQKATIEAKRQAAIAKCKRRLEQEQAKMTTPTKIAAPDDGTKKPAAVSVASSSSCKNPKNESLYQAFCELARLYQKEENYPTVATYKRVASAIQSLELEVTQDNAKGLGMGKAKVPHIGKASAEKMYEFVTNGTIAKLEEKKAALTEKGTTK